MSKPKDSKRGKGKGKRPAWYRLAPWALALPVLLFIGVWLPPLARGEPFDWASLEAALWLTAIAVLAALLVGWLAWRCCFRSSTVANLVFSMAIIGCGVWSIALDESQRDRARFEVVSAIDHQVVNVKEQLRDVLE